MNRDRDTEFKDRLKLIKTETKKTTIQLAKDLNKGESAIRMWEIGRSKPDADTLIALAGIFECSTDYLLGLSDNTETKPNETLLALLKDMENETNAPVINNALKNHQLQYFLFDLIRALDNNKKKNKEIGETQLFSLFQAILKDDNPNIYRIWGHQLINVELIIKRIFRLNKLDEHNRELRKKLGNERAAELEKEHHIDEPGADGAEQLVTLLNGFFGAATHRQSIYEEELKKMQQSE